MPPVTGIQKVTVILQLGMRRKQTHLFHAASPSSLRTTLHVYIFMHLSMLHPTTSCTGYSEARWGFLTSIAPIYGADPIIKFPQRRRGYYWVFDIQLQYIALFHVSSEVIKCLTIRAPSSIQFNAS